MEDRMFPIQGGIARTEDGQVKRPISYYKRTHVPWWLAEIAYEHYHKLFSNGQTLETLAERGGFGREEFVKLLRKDDFK